MAAFFEHQEQARKRTKLLVFLFTLAVIGIATSIYLFLAWGLAASGNGKAAALWDPELFAWVFGGTIGFIGLASTFRVLSLRAGGGAVAQMLGGRLVSRDTRDLAERRLLNVVDEMAIASGIPVPEVYVLDQEVGINAFAAGYTTDNAAIAVTRGALETLTRDELQGVIAHEFSHILNGDMRLNIRLIGVLFGILAIAVVGRFLLYSVRSSSSRRNKGVPAIVLLGLALMLIGYIGVFVGRIIQAAVSRQREFLADASAVQFTRNPAGIGGALLKIAGLERGSALQSPRTSEVGHLLFGEGSPGSFLSGLFATHPPIEERVRRIDPALLAERAAARGEARGAGRGAAQAASGAGVAAPAGASGLAGGAQHVAVRPAEVAERVGSVDAGAIGFAAALIANLPEAVQQALRDPEEASLLMYAVVLDSGDAARHAQLRILANQAGEQVAERVASLHREVAGRRVPALPLVELAAPALATWPQERQNAFLKNLLALIQADQQITLFEFGLWWLLTRRLRKTMGPVRAVYRSIEKVAWEAAQLLAAIAQAGNPGRPEAALEAFRTGLSQLNAGPRDEVLSRFQAGALGGRDAVAEALDHLVLASLAVRRRVVEAAAHCALADREITLDEAELLRLFSIGLGCPLPPWANPADSSDPG